MAGQFIDHAVFLFAVRRAMQEQRIPSEMQRIRRDTEVYSRGQRDHSVYLMDSGEVKVMQTTRDGRECITALHTVNDIFGEMCLCGDVERPDTAIARQDTTVRRIAAADLVALIGDEALHLEFMRHLARRMTEQQELIATLLTSNSECRLANTLLIMGRRSNRRDASGRLVAPDLRQGELAAMVGTTRTRIGMFLKKFRRLGLIHPHTPGTLAVAEERMRTFIDYAGSDPGGGASSCPGRGPAQGASAGSLA